MYPGLDHRRWSHQDQRIGHGEAGAGWWRYHLRQKLKNGSLRVEGIGRSQQRIFYLAQGEGKAIYESSPVPDSRQRTSPRCPLGKDNNRRQPLYDLVPPFRRIKPCHEWNTGGSSLQGTVVIHKTVKTWLNITSDRCMERDGANSKFRINFLNAGGETGRLHRPAGPWR